MKSGSVDIYQIMFENKTFISLLFVYQEYT